MSSTESWNLQSRTSESSVTNYFSFLNFLIASNKYIDFLHSSFLCPATPCLCMCCLSVRTQTFHLFSICSPWISHFRSTKFVLQFNHGNVTYIFIYLKINIFPKSPIQLFFWGRSSRMRGVKWVGQGEVACHVASISPKCQCHMRWYPPWTALTEEVYIWTTWIKSGVFLLQSITEDKIDHFRIVEGQIWPFFLKI